MNAAQTCRWHPVADRDAMGVRAAARIVAAAARALDARGQFHIVLAGGNTPVGTYARLRGISTDWGAWHVWFGDERCVPVDDTERNSRMAATAWLDHVALLPAQVHPIPAELGAAIGAERYARTLAKVAEFDLVLLGLGDDGHTASLFPGHPWGDASGSPAALAVLDAPKPPPQRVSLSASRLGFAREVLFLVDGDDKRDAIAAWRAGELLPAAAIRPAAGVDVIVTAALV
ncbi:MAG: 6-phosphogluconolactonase [Casimicrobiaceae bacterium]